MTKSRKGSPYLFRKKRPPEKHLLVTQLADKFYKPLAKLMHERSFTGKAGSTLTVPCIRKDKPFYLIFIGIGDTDIAQETVLENYRRAIGTLIRTAESLKIDTIACGLGERGLVGPDRFDISVQEFIAETVATSIIANYQFCDFLTKPESCSARDLIMTLCIPESWSDAAHAGCELGQRIGHAVNQTRHWCDLPGNHITPATFADRARGIAQTHKITLNILGKTEMCAMGMGGICAVGQGSAEEPSW